MSGFSADYLAPFALALNASTRQIAVLSALPSLCASLVQLKTADVTDYVQSRKRVILAAVLLHILAGIPIVLIPYLSGIPAVPVVIICVTLFTSFGAFAGPAWASLMTEYIPSRARGRYFGWRNKVMGVATVIASFIAGFILHTQRHHGLAGFTVIFGLALASRCFSWAFLARMYEPPMPRSQGKQFGFWEFVLQGRTSNFTRFVLFVAAMNFCVNLAAPFFAVFMLRDLSFSYLTYTVLMVTVTLASLATINRWGHRADAAGNLKVVKLTSLFIASLPLWWLLNRHPAFIFFVQAFGGIVWAGFNLCAVNFIYDAVTPAKRVRCFAYFNVVTGVASCAGALVGGYAVAYMPPILGYKLLGLFVFSSALRFLVAGTLPRTLREVRPIQRVSSRDLFYSVIGVQRLTGESGEPAARPSNEA
jgi:MFS family permease